MGASVSRIRTAVDFPPVLKSDHTLQEHVPGGITVAPGASPPRAFRKSHHAATIRPQVVPPSATRPMSPARFLSYHAARRCGSTMMGRRRNHEHPLLCCSFIMPILILAIVALSRPGATAARTQAVTPNPPAAACRQDVAARLYGRLRRLVPAIYPGILYPGILRLCRHLPGNGVMSQELTCRTAAGTPCCFGEALHSHSHRGLIEVRRLDA